MKVGTDGVLLGAWADVVTSCRVLDLGCGSGLIALMLAQRTASDAQVTGIELDEAAAADARHNVAASPFAQQVRVICGDVTRHEAAGGYDHIVSNPPYHEEELLPPGARRAAARHTSGGLSFAALLHSVDRLLGAEPDARFSLIIPTWALPRFLPLAACHGLFPARRTDVVTKVGKAPKRTLLELRRGSCDCLTEELALMDADGQRAEAYRRLCGGYYL